MFNSHLWRDVVRGAAEGARGHAFVHVLLAHAEIRDLDVALGVQHYVVQLQIPTVETCLFCFLNVLRRERGKTFPSLLCSTRVLHQEIISSLKSPSFVLFALQSECLFMFEILIHQ